MDPLSPFRAQAALEHTLSELAPSPAKRRASAAPIPLAPPLIRATLFSRRMFHSWSANQAGYVPLSRAAVGSD